jgi:HAD superfamily hydrolase (TIGR01549 family)
MLDDEAPRGLRERDRGRRGTTGLTTAAIVDVDGTLVDTNYHHALAWQRAFRAHGVSIPAWLAHRHVGMGGDKLVGAVAGDDVERALGDRIRETEGELYMQMVDEVEPLPGARELLAALADRADSVVLASSAREQEVELYLDLLDARDLVSDWTTSADVEATKPEPDLVRVALAKGNADEALMIGDTVWDCEAAARAGVPIVAVLCGGFGAAELREAGARAVFDSPAALRKALDDLPVLGRSR